jgi:hypothetical protein
MNFAEIFSRGGTLARMTRTKMGSVGIWKGVVGCHTLAPAGLSWLRASELSGAACTIAAMPPTAGWSRFAIRWNQHPSERWHSAQCYERGCSALLAGTEVLSLKSARLRRSLWITDRWSSLSTLVWGKAAVGIRRDATWPAVASSSWGSHAVLCA